MKTFRIHFSLLFITILLFVTSAQAAPKQQSIQGTVMSAETNKPVAGADITFFSRNDKGMTNTPSAKTVSNSGGKFQVRLPSGAYSWFAKAEGVGTMQSGTMVAAKPVDLNTVYLRKPAELSGRLVDGSGAPVAGATLNADNFNATVSAADGRFRFTGLDPHGYEPALRKPDWVLEKSVY